MNSATTPDHHIAKSCAGAPTAPAFSSTHVLGRHAIATVAGGYRLELGDNKIDLLVFERLVESAEQLNAIGEHERAVIDLEAALSMVTGEPLADVDSWGPGVAAAARYSELTCQAEEHLVLTRLASGQYSAALVEARELVVREPLREQRWGALALAQYRDGRQGEALRTIERARGVIAAELGLDLGQELLDLQRAILAHDPDLAGPEPSHGRRAISCPYRGLAAYEVEDADWFFGRDREIAACLEIVDATGFVVVVGASGSGKSSLARAGVATPLRRRGRDVAIITPTSEPDTALAGVGHGSVLVVDQLEELFALCRDAPAKQRFAATICRWSSTAPVVVTLRADHLAAVAELPDLAAHVQAGIYLLGPMREPELRSAIQGPADKAGLRLEPGLVDVLVRDVVDQPGALPLLSHALAQTFEQREGPVLTAAGYRAVGGVQAAVARAADQVIDSFPPDGRRAARDLFLRLVTASDMAEPVRQRVPRAALATDPTTSAVLDALVRARLVTAAEDTVEIAHDAVCTAWPRLRAWLDEDRDGLRIRWHLTHSAQEWERSGREPSELYRGPRLVATLDWAVRGQGDLNDSERAFLDASVRRRDSKQEEARQRALRQESANRRLRAALRGVAILLAVAVASGLLAFSSDRHARQQREEARAAQRTAQHEALVNRSLALRSSNRALAALLAVEAYRREPDARAWSALLGTFTATPGFAGYRQVPDARFLAGTLLPGGAAAVVAVDGRAPVLVDVRTGAVERRFTRQPGSTGPYDDSVVRVSADGRFVAHLTGTPGSPASNAVSVYEVRSGRLVVGPITAPFAPGDIAVNPDGSLLAVAGGPAGEAAVYHLPDGKHVGAVPGPPHQQRPVLASALARNTAAVTFGPDGRIYLGSTGGSIRAVGPSSLRVEHSYQAPPYSSHNQMLLARADLLVAAGDEATVAINVESGRLLWSIPRTPLFNACSAIAVSVSADRMYCQKLFAAQISVNVGRVGQIEERDLTTGRPTGLMFDSQQGNVGDLSVSSDGRELVTFSHNSPVLSRWRLDGTGPAMHRIDQGLLGARYDPAGTMLLVRQYSSGGLFAQEANQKALQWSVWDPATGRRIDALDGVLTAAWAGPPGRLAAIFADGTAGLYDVRRHARMPGVVIDAGARPAGSSWSADGRRFFVWDVDGRIRIFDSAEGNSVGAVIEPGGAISTVSDSQDGSRIVVSSYRSGGWETTVLDGDTGEPVGPALRDVNASRVSPSGTLVGSNWRGEITEYNLETLDPVGSLPSARGFVNHLEFSRDGRLLLATSQDRTVSLYDMATKSRLGDPIPRGTGGGAGSLRADGMAMAVGDGSGVAIWDLDPTHLAGLACELAGRNLTQDEWASYLGHVGDFRPTCPVPN